MDTTSVIKVVERDNTCDEGGAETHDASRPDHVDVT